ncbi:MAG: hypothetical protein ABI353_21345 [Isosphaeraceae bacterium]
MNPELLNELTKRIEQLEFDGARWRREKRRWTWAAALATLIVGLLFISVLKIVEGRKSVESDRFLLRGKDGELRAAWYIRPDNSPIFELYGDQRSARISMDVTSKGLSRLSGYDRQGVRRTETAIYPNGDTIMSIHDQSDRPKITMYVNHDGEPIINLSGDSGQPRISSRVRSNGVASLVLGDARGKKRIGMSADSEDASDLSLFDQSGTTRMEAMVDASKSPQLLLRDSQGKILMRSFVSPSEFAAIDFLDRDRMVRLLLGRDMMTFYNKEGKTVFSVPSPATP